MDPSMYFKKFLFSILNGFCELGFNNNHGHQKINIQILTNQYHYYEL